MTRSPPIRIVRALSVYISNEFFSCCFYSTILLHSLAAYANWKSASYRCPLLPKHMAGRSLSRTDGNSNNTLLLLTRDQRRQFRQFVCERRSGQTYQSIAFNPKIYFELRKRYITFYYDIEFRAPGHQSYPKKNSTCVVNIFIAGLV